MIQRRSFITGIGAFFACAPAIVRVASLMPVSAAEDVVPLIYSGFDSGTNWNEIITTTIWNRTKYLADSITQNNALTQRLFAKQMIIYHG